MSSNYRKLMGMRGVLRVAAALRHKTFDDLQVEDAL